MTHYTEVPVLLRFRSDQPLSFDEVRFRLQACNLKDLCEYVVVERPHDASGEAWTGQHRAMEAMATAVDYLLS